MKKPIESVWEYPRPPRLEPFDGTLEVRTGGTQVAMSTRGFRVLETSHPPGYYIPREDVTQGMLERSGRTSVCEFKGVATYWHIRTGDRLIRDGAWSYEDPTEAFRPIAGHLAFYAEKMDDCFVNGERVIPQEGNFYGGWITANIRGPFKGGPGTMGW